MANIIFLKVTDNATKLKRLCIVVQQHFLTKEKVLITTSSHEVATYIDQLLWRIPEDSFVPHVIANHPTNDHIVITTTATNVNQAKTLVNLCPSIANSIDTYTTIYELLDLTHPEKEKLSRAHQEAYRSAGYKLTEI